MSVWGRAQKKFLNKINLSCYDERIFDASLKGIRHFKAATLNEGEGYD